MQSDTDPTGSTTREGRPPTRWFRRGAAVVGPLIFVGLLLFSTADYWASLVAPFLPGQRLERTEAGFAISLPADWEFADAAGADPGDWWDGDVVGDVREHHAQVVAEGGLLVARRRSPLVHENCILSDFTAKAVQPLAWTSVVHATTEVRFLEEDPEIVDVKAAFLDLPAGRATRIDTLRDDGWGESSFYLKAGARWFLLVCAAETPSDDSWLPIVESFELLSTRAPDMAEPILGPQDIERPDSGFAITLPYHWHHADANALDPVEWFDADSVDGAKELHEQSLADGLLLKAQSYLPLEASTQWCDLQDVTHLATQFPSWATLQDAEAHYMLWEDDPDNVVVEAGYLDLPSGRALRIDSRWQGGTVARYYIYNSGARWVALECATQGTVPEDRWLPIAETFKFLPAEE